MTKKTKSAVENQPIYQHTKGVVKDNAVMALLHDKLFHQRVEKKRKGKGSYQRKAKYASNWFEKPRDYESFHFKTPPYLRLITYDYTKKYFSKMVIS